MHIPVTPGLVAGMCIPLVSIVFTTLSLPYPVIHFPLPYDGFFLSRFAVALALFVRITPGRGSTEQ
jgi:hypothetical protein